MLDIGPGYGFGYPHLLRANPKSITCIDLDKRAETKFLYKDPKVGFLVKDFMHNNLPANSYDVITCFGTFFYFTDHDKFFKEVKRVLKPGGVLLFNDFNQDVLDALFGYKLHEISTPMTKGYNYKTLKTMVEKHFSKPAKWHVQLPVMAKPKILFYPGLVVALLVWALEKPTIHKKKSWREGLFNNVVVRK